VASRVNFDDIICLPSFVKTQEMFQKLLGYVQADRHAGDLRGVLSFLNK
jgi:hypothetical protein